MDKKTCMSLLVVVAFLLANIGYAAIIMFMNVLFIPGILLSILVISCVILGIYIIKVYRRSNGQIN